MVREFLLIQIVFLSFVSFNDPKLSFFRFPNLNSCFTFGFSFRFISFWKTILKLNACPLLFRLLWIWFLVTLGFKCELRKTLTKNFPSFSIQPNFSSFRRWFDKEEELIPNFCLISFFPNPEDSRFRITSTSYLFFRGVMWT